MAPASGTRRLMSAGRRGLQDSPGIVPGEDDVQDPVDPRETEEPGDRARTGNHGHWHRVAPETLREADEEGDPEAVHECDAGEVDQDRRLSVSSRFEPVLDLADPFGVHSAR